MRVWAAALLCLAACRGAELPPAPRPAVAEEPAATPAPAPHDVTAEHYPMPRLPRGTARLRGADGAQHTVEVEVAATTAARTRGLMWRYALPEGTGMLFIFAGDEPLSFWMRNTLIPLDMFFIAADGTVVTVVDSAEPQTLTSRRSTQPAKYVLEVPGGWAKKRHLAAGARVELEGVGGIVPEP